MPSPFPGMDPYLEGDLWTTFHAQMVPQIARHLTQLLIPKYIAFAQRKNVAGDIDEMGIVLQRLEPDIGVEKKRRGRLDHSHGVQLQEPPLRLHNLPTTEFPYFWVEIRDLAKRRLITSIEFLSPSNKNGHGRKTYLKKREHLLASSTHLLEIDFHRRGQRVPLEEELPAADYFIFLSRANLRPQVEVWPLEMTQPLPIVPVPLLKMDKDAPLDLGKAFTEMYDACRYDLAIDYTKPPEVPFTSTQTAWVKQLLRKAGKRK